MEDPKITEEKEMVEETEAAEEKKPDGEGCFKCRMKKFNEFYLHLVVGVGVLLAAAIWVGMKAHVIAGLAVAAVAVCAYALSLAEYMKKKLGLAYTRVQGGVSLTVVDTGSENNKWDVTERYIPSRIMWLDVVEIGGRNKKQKADTGVTAIHIPLSVKKIEKDAFESMTALDTIAYEGTEEEWKEIDILTDLSKIETITFLAEK